MACFVSGDVSALSNSTASMDISEGGSEWLPLHVAVFYGVRVEIVDFLMEQYPAAVTLKNGCGMLPLHLAVSCATFDPQEKQKVIQLLLQTFPESLHIPSSGREGKTAYEIVQQEDKNSPEKEALLEMLHPKQSQGTNTTIERVVQSLWLDNNQGYVEFLCVCREGVLQSRFRVVICARCIFVSYDTHFSLTFCHHVVDAPSIVQSIASTFHISHSSTESHWLEPSTFQLDYVATTSHTFQFRHVQHDHVSFQQYK
jgi:hypothetical protein